MVYPTNLPPDTIEGRQFCSNLEDDARETALARSREAWITVGIAAGFTVGSAVMTAMGPPSEDHHPEANKAFKGVNVGLTAAAAALAGATVYMFQPRSCG